MPKKLSAPSRIDGRRNPEYMRLYMCAYRRAERLGSKVFWRWNGEIHERSAKGWVSRRVYQRRYMRLWRKKRDARSRKRS